MYARDTSKKLIATWQAKGRSGEHVSSRPPYGYKKDPTDPKKWIVDEEAAAVVQKIFSLCVEGYGIHHIRNWLRDHDVRCPVAYFQSKGIKTAHKPPLYPTRWQHQTVSEMLERIEYLGHTVNFRTKKQSFKSKKIVFNPPDEWLIFENTQEPIIEESVFMIVQNIRKSRRRPNKIGEVNMFSGLLIYADCGKKLYINRGGNLEKRLERFICSTYAKDTRDCTGHIIRTVVLEEIVLRNLREAIQYVSAYEDDFIREASAHSTRQRGKETAQKSKALANAEKRIGELDVIFKRLYEDNISGKLSDERFAKLSGDYENEQAELKLLVDNTRKELQQIEQETSNLKHFVSIVRKYTDLQELNAAVLREFIEKIVVSAVDRKTKKQEIKIVYNFLGAFDFENAIAKTKAKDEAVKSA